MMLPLSSTESGRLAIEQVFSGGEDFGGGDLFAVRYLEGGLKDPATGIITLICKGVEVSLQCAIFAQKL